MKTTQKFEYQNVPICTHDEICDAVRKVFSTPVLSEGEAIAYANANNDTNLDPLNAYFADCCTIPQYQPVEYAAQGFARFCYEQFCTSMRAGTIYMPVEVQQPKA